MGGGNFARPRRNLAMPGEISGLAAGFSRIGNGFLA
jgi:hypothetical protein